MRISSNKQAVVGWGAPHGFREAVLWRGGHTFGLGDLPGGAASSEAQAVSNNGSRIVGSSKAANGDTAFLWDRWHGMRSLKEALAGDYGVDVEGWNLTWATGISDEGATIAGYGGNPAGINEGWIARLLAMPAAMDFDADGDVDAQDVARFADCATRANVPYSGGNVPPACGQTVDVLGVLPADLDWDGDVDPDDFALLQRCFNGPDPVPVDCRG
jgi:hypothetical protein